MTTIPAKTQPTIIGTAVLVEGLLGLPLQSFTERINVSLVIIALADLLPRTATILLWHWRMALAYGIGVWHWHMALAYGIWIGILCEIS